MANASSAPQVVGQRENHKRIMDRVTEKLNADDLFLENINLSTAQRKAHAGSNLVEKFAFIFEGLFLKDDIAPETFEKEEFWLELLLLKVNVKCVEKCFVLSSEDQLIGRSRMVSTMMRHYMKCLGDDSNVRVIHSLQTLCVVIRFLSRKRFSGEDILKVLAGENPTEFFDSLVSTLSALLLKETTVYAKLLAVKLVNVLTQDAVMMKYLTDPCLCSALLHLTLNIELQHSIALDLITALLSLLHHDPAGDLPNLHRQIFIDSVDEDMAQGLLTACDVLANEAAAFLFSQKFRTATLWESLAQWKSSVVTETPMQLIGQPARTCECFSFGQLLMLLHVLLVSPSVVARSAMVRLSLEISSNAPPDTELEAAAGVQESQEILDSSGFVESVESLLFVLSLLTDCSSDPEACKISNLATDALTALIESRELTEKLTQLSNLDFRIWERDRHGVGALRIVSGPSRPLSGVVCVCLSIISSNLKRKLDLDLHVRCLMILHRSLCHLVEMKLGGEMGIDWQKFWGVIFRVVDFVATVDVTSEKDDLIPVIIAALTNLNILLSFSDAFFPAEIYYVLCYELTRIGANSIFVKLVDAVRGSELSGGVTKLLDNILLIVTEISAKINLWEKDHPEDAATHDQIMEIVKTVMDSLALSPQNQLLYFSNISSDGEDPTTRPNVKSCFRQLVLNYKECIQVVAGL